MDFHVSSLELLFKKSNIAFAHDGCEINNAQQLHKYIYEMYSTCLEHRNDAEFDLYNKLLLVTDNFYDHGIFFVGDYYYVGEMNYKDVCSLVYPNIVNTLNEFATDLFELLDGKNLFPKGKIRMEPVWGSQVPIKQYKAMISFALGPVFQYLLDTKLPKPYSFYLFAKVNELLKQFEYILLPDVFYNKHHWYK